jgi:hypothetical protein
MAYMAPLGQLAMTGFLALIPTAVIFYLANRSQPMIIRLRASENIKAALEARKMNSAKLRRIITARSATDVGTLMNTQQEIISDVRELDQRIRQSYQELGNQRKPSRWMSLGVVLALLVSTSIVTIPLAITSFIGGISSAFLFYRAVERGHHSVLRAVWPSVVVALLLSALGAGLEGYVPGAAIGQYEFDKTQAPSTTDGRYVNLAESGTFLYLQSCESKTHPVMKIQKDAIQQITLSRKDPFRRNPTLYGALRGKPFVLGAKPNC